MAMRILIAIILILTACGKDDGKDGEATTVVVETKDAPSESSPEPKVAEKTEVEPEEEAVVEPTFDHWEDPATNRDWYRFDMVDAPDAVCGASYEVPDVLDLNAAKLNGFLTALNEHNEGTLIWVKNISNGVVEAYRDLSDSTTHVAQTGARLWCVSAN